MFVLQAEITIGSHVFTQVNDVQIHESRHTIGDTAVVKLPRLLTQLNKEIQVGAEATIKLGYEDVYFETEFVGYVSKISPNFPYTVELEDTNFHAKRTNLLKAFKATTLKEVVDYIVSEISTQTGASVNVANEVPEVEFEKFRLNNVSATEAFAKLKKEYGLSIYFRGSDLYVGLPFGDTQSAGITVNYSTSWNIIKSNLKFVSEDDKKIKIKAISILKDNSKLEVEVGDSNGEQRTLHYYKISNKAKLEELAKAQLDELKYTGFEGGFKTFLIPAAHHGMVANIKDPDFDEGRAGNYLIDSVTTSFGQQGARRNIELGILL